jgi:hypothetical protein
MGGIKIKSAASHHYPRKQPRHADTLISVLTFASEAMGHFMFILTPESKRRRVKVD